MAAAPHPNRRSRARVAAPPSFGGWTGGLAALALATVAAYAVVFLGRPWGDRGALILSDFGQVPVEVAGTVLAAVVVLRDARPGARVAWSLIALALGCNLAGNVAYGAWDVGGQQPFPSVADVFYLASYPLLLGGVLSLPTATGRRETFSWRAWSNVAIVVLGGGMALIQFAFVPAIAQLSDDALESVVSLAYPAGDLAMLAALGTIAARRPFAADRRALGCFIAALGAWFFADVGFAIVSTSGGYVPGSPPDLLWLGGDVLFLLAAQDHLRGLGGPDAHTPTAAPSIGRAGPYVMLTVGLGTLLVGAIAPGPQMMLLVVLAAGLTIIVVLRQLVDEHERRVAEAALLAEQSQAAAEAARQARLDPLTGLRNRASLRETLASEIAAFPATRRPVTLVFLDLDRLKEVNDTLGHGAGDRLLAEVGRRLEASVRAQDIVARVGGDEFAIVLPDTPLEAGLAVAGRASAALEAPIAVAGREVEIRASIGLASYPASGAADDDALMHQADTAMYRAKRLQLPPTVYETSHETRGQALSDVAELRRAVEGDELVLLFQPISARPAGRLVAAEALVRWRHPSRGLLGASEVVPLATESGLIRALDRRVLDLACAQATAWRRAGVVLRTTINVSRHSLQEREFEPAVRAALAHHGLPGDAIELEITEDGLIDDPAAVREFVEAMRELGVRLAIDDFGTGFSSLRRLRDLRVNALKIDQGFVRNALHAPADAAIVAAVTDLGHRLGVEVVAEGVEDEGTLAWLDRCGVDYAQGHHVGRPLDAQHLAGVLLGGRLNQRELRAPHRPAGTAALQAARPAGG